MAEKKRTRPAVSPDELLAKVSFARLAAPTEAEVSLHVLKASLVAHKARQLLDDGYRDEATELVQKHLRSSAYISAPAFLSLVADLLDKPKKGRGRPKTTPERWYEIGLSYHSLRGEGLTYEDAVQRLVESKHASASKIERTLRYFAERMGSDEP